MLKYLHEFGDSLVSYPFSPFLKKLTIHVVIINYQDMHFWMCWLEYIKDEWLSKFCYILHPIPGLLSVLQVGPKWPLTSSLYSTSLVPWTPQGKAECARRKMLPFWMYTKMLYRVLITHNLKLWSLLVTFLKTGSLSVQPVIL